MNDNARFGAALVGGYLLGRTKKGKSAMRLAMMFAGRRVTANPGMLWDGLERLVGSTGNTQLLEQVRGPLLEAAKKAAVATVESRANTLSERLAQHTAELTGSASQQPPAESGSTPEADTEEPPQDSESDDETDSGRRRAPQRQRSREPQRSAENASEEDQPSGQQRRSARNQRTGENRRSERTRQSSGEQGEQRQGKQQQGRQRSAARSGGTRTSSRTERGR